jgi:DNA-binding MarR family transcriptional regulator
MSGGKSSKNQTRSVSQLLKRAVQYANQLYLAEAGKHGLTQRQFTLLSALSADEGMSQTDLVKLTGIDRSTLADLVQRLSEQNYLQSKRSKDDARTNTVRLTAAGVKAVKTVQGAADQVDKALLALLSPAERKSTIAALTIWSDAFDNADGEEEEAPPAKVKLRKASWTK